MIALAIILRLFFFMALMSLIVLALIWVATLSPHLAVITVLLLFIYWSKG